MKALTFTTASLYFRWIAGFCILIGFAFFGLDKHEHSNYFAILYILLTAPEVISKVTHAFKEK